MNEIILNPDGFAILDVSIRPNNSQTMEIVRFKVDTAFVRTRGHNRPLRKQHYGSKPGSNRLVAQF